MRPPTIPDTLAICSVCKDAFAMPGKQQCCDCLLATRFAAWALADGEVAPEPPRVFGERRIHGGVSFELPPGLRFIGDPVTKSFVPEEPVAYRPCPCGCGRQDPVYGIEGFATPRITEVAALPASQQRAALASRRSALLALRVGWLVLVALTCGWLFGRFG